LKIALISQNSSPGLIIFRKDLIISLVNSGHTVFAFSIDYTESSKKFVEALGAIPVDYSLSKVGINPIVDVFDTIKLAVKLKEISPDCVLSFFVKPSLYGTLAAMLARVPRRIAMLEGLGYIHTPIKKGISLKKKLLQWIHGLLCSFSYKFAHKVLFLNSDDPYDLSKVAFLNKSKIQVIGAIGLDLNAYAYKPVKMVSSIRFIFIARLLAEKGIFEYLEAARFVKIQYPQTEFVVLGGLDPDNPTALSKHALDKVISEGIVIYPGHVSNVTDWIADSHVFVLPSYREGLPRSTQEAMAIGRAIITTDVPGCRETVTVGVNGFLVQPWDAQAIAMKMLYFIDNPGEIKRMGDESHRIAVDRFDVNKANLVMLKIITGEH